jgi:hypothetical protein
VLVALAILMLRPPILRSLVAWARSSAGFLAGWLVPQAAFAAYQFFAFSFDTKSWAAAQAREWAFLTGTASLSGVGQIQDAASFMSGLTANAARNFDALSGFCGSWIRLIPAVAATVVLAVLVIRSREVAPAVRRAATFFAAAIVVHLCWWSFISPTGWFRHLFPALIYATGLAGLLVSAGLTARLRAAWPAAAACLVSALWILPAWIPQTYESHKVFAWGFRKDARLEALLSAKAAVEPLAADPNIVLVGCGWWVTRDLEYVLPEVRNFRDCTRLTDQDIAGKRVMLVRNDFFNRERNPVVDRYQTNCDRRIVFRRDPYVVSECEGLPK